MLRQLFLLLLTAPFFVNAQITITQADLPSAGDTYLFSVADTLLGVDPTATGANFNWDYSTLEHATQLEESWVSPTSTNIFYASLFPISNVASDFSDLDFGGVTLEDAFNFYDNTSAGFAQTGLAGVVSSIPLPIPFDIPDEILQYPLNYNDTWSGPSGFEIAIPTLATLIEERDRATVVDGWGSLTTPYGTFDVLRVRADIAIKDSLSSASLGDFVIERNTTEYRWYANGMGAPVLQIDVQNVLGTSIVSRIIYQDSVRTDDTSSTGIAQLIPQSLKLYPVPASSFVTLEFELAAQSDLTIDLIDLQGRVVKSWNFAQQVGAFREVLSTDNVAAGKYLIDIRSLTGRQVLPLVIE